MFNKIIDARMAKWYTQYAKVYDQEVGSVNNDVIEKVRAQIQLSSSSDPIISIVVIAYNEEKKLLACL